MDFFGARSDSKEASKQGLGYECHFDDWHIIRDELYPFQVMLHDVVRIHRIHLTHMAFVLC